MEAPKIPRRRKRKARTGRQKLHGEVTFTFSKSGVLRIKHGALNRAMNDWLATARGTRVGAQLVLKGTKIRLTQGGCGDTPVTPNTMCACDSGCPTG